MHISTCNPLAATHAEFAKLARNKQTGEMWRNVALCSVCVGGLQRPVAECLERG